MEDLIKRSDVKQAIYELLLYLGEEDINTVVETVMKDIPSADRPSGEWIPNPKIGWGETWVCSVCGEKTTSTVMGYPRYTFCPMCGARMKGREQ